MVAPGDAFLGDPGVVASMGGKHLWIVVAVNESDFDTAIYVVLVNVTSTTALFKNGSRARLRISRCNRLALPTC
jgi:hypothetical protein